MYEYFEAEQKRLECTIQGGVCREPIHDRYEKVTKTLNAAKERVRKTSASIMGASSLDSRSQDVSAASSSRGGYVNNNFVIDVNDPVMEDDSDGISVVERNIRARMMKREEILR